MFYAIRNLRDLVAFEVEKPWEVWQNYPTPPELTDKKSVEHWRASVRTNHVFLSGVSGVEPRARVSRGQKKDEMANPPRLMHAFVVDYDVDISDAEVRNILEKPVNSYVPNYVCNTFQKGRRRLIWLFERPLLLGGTHAAATAFANRLAAELKVSKWLPGLDETTVQPNRYFAIGTNWQALSPSPLPHHILSAWAMMSDSQLQFTAHSLSPPPIDRIADLVEERFPGRWQGAFDLGARGIRFWDARADNPTAAVVMPEGMRCFTGQQGFVTWEDIFGARTIDEIRGETQGVLRDRVVWDLQKFWVYQEPTDEWVPFSKEDFAQFLVCSVGMDARKPRGGGPSRVEKFINEVRLNHRVQEALPFVFRPQGKTMYMGDCYLNTAKVKVMPPAPAPLYAPDSGFHDAGPAAFPWFHNVLSHFFAPTRGRPKWVPSSVPDKDIQVMHYLAWMHRFYKSGYEQRPLPGQAIIIGGMTGRGKGMLTSGAMAKMMGGSADGSAFLVNNEQWTSEVLRKPMITVDDDTSGDDVQSHRNFTTKLKKMVANAQASYNKKYGSSGRVEWLGRVTITCNLDPESLRILPDMNQSNGDKIMLFLAGEGVDLPDKNSIEDILNRELPHFCRWLIDWKVPAWLLAGDDRFWVRSYHHPTLLEASAGQGTAANVLEMLREVYDAFVEADETELNDRGVELRTTSGSKQYVWRGAVRQLQRLMRRVEVMQVDRYTTQQVGTMLGILSSRGFKITKLIGQDWEIVFDRALLSNHVSSDTSTEEPQSAAPEVQDAVPA